MNVEYSLMQFQSSLKYTPQLEIGFGSWEKYDGVAFFYDFEERRWLFKKGTGRKKGVPLTVIEISDDFSEFYFEYIYKDKKRHFKLFFDGETERAVLRFFKKVWENGFPLHEIKIDHCSPCIDTRSGQIDYMKAMNLDPDGSVVPCRGIHINLKRYDREGNQTDSLEKVVRDEFVYWHAHHISHISMDGENMTVETATGVYTHPVRTVGIILELWSEIVASHIPYIPTN